jgi:signal peptidase II
MRAVSTSVFFAVLIACVGCDHAAKRAAGLLLTSGERVTLAGDAFQFELVSNPGAFLSLGAGLPDPVRQALLVGLVPLLLACVCLYFLRSAHTSFGELVALGLVAGGGLGNWLDRLLHDGAVTDFVSMGLGGLRTGIFNVADVAVMAGVLLLVLFVHLKRAEA